MDQHNIDRLFREKLGGVEVAPSPKAWNEVEKQIGGKKKPVFYWVAASITLLLTVSVVLWPNQPASNQLSLGEADHPILPNDQGLSIPVAADLSKPKQEKAVATPARPVQQKARIVQVAKVELTEDVKAESNNPLEIPEMEIKRVVALEETTIPVSEVPEMEDASTVEEKIDYSAVKITYIASNKSIMEDEITESDSSGVFKKFIAFTEKIDPGEMLADIKTAKDDLLKGGLKNKREKSAMTP